MQIQHQVPIRRLRHLFVHAQGVAPIGGKRLHHQIANAQLIARIVEGHNVMGIARNGFGILARGKQILTQLQDGDVTMMRVFGKQIQHPFVVAPFLHQIVQDQQPTLGWVPGVQVGGLGKPFVKMDAPFLQWFETRFPGPVAIMKGRRWARLEIVPGLFQQPRHKIRLATPRRSSHHDAGGCAKHDAGSLSHPTTPPCPFLNSHTHTGPLFFWSFYLFLLFKALDLSL